MSFEQAILIGIFQWIGLHMFVSIIGTAFKDKFAKSKELDKGKLFGTAFYALIMLVAYLYVIYYFIQLWGTL